MKKSDLNKGVLDNFILWLTHCNDEENELGYKEHITLTPKLLYEAVKSYIEEDHVDGKDNAEDHIVTYGTESSFVTEDDFQIHPEQTVIVADFGEEEGTQTVCIIDTVDIEGVNTLLEFIKDPYKHKM